MDDIFSDQVAKPRFYMKELNAAALLGLLLASIGVYGVVALTGARRATEFGIRMALGARPSDIMRLVLTSGSRVIAIGTLLGLAGALAATRLLSALLFEVKPWDLLSLLITELLILSIALLSCWLAARNAIEVDVSLAMRNE